MNTFTSCLAVLGATIATMGAILLACAINACIVDGVQVDTVPESAALHVVALMALGLVLMLIAGLGKLLYNAMGLR